MQSINEFFSRKPKIKIREPSHQINLLKTKSSGKEQVDIDSVLSGSSNPSETTPEKHSYFSSKTSKIVLPTSLGLATAGGLATYGKDLTPNPKPEVSADEWKSHSEAWKKNVEDRKRLKEEEEKRQQEEENLKTPSNEAQFRVKNSESKLSDKSYARDLYRTGMQQPETPNNEAQFRVKNSESKLSDKSYARDLYRTGTQSSQTDTTPKEEPSFLKKLDKEYGDYLPVVGLGGAIGLGGYALARKLRNRRGSDVKQV